MSLRVIVIGAGEVGYYLADRLSLEGHHIVVIDKDEDKIKRIERLLNVMAVQGSGASAKVLEEAGIKETDLFVAVTSSDEINLIACLLAREYGVPRKVARVRSEDYLSPDSPLNEQKLGIDLIINPARVLADEIVKLSEITEATDWAEFARGKVILMGYVVKEESPLAGISLADLRELRALYDFVIVAIIRNNETIIPRGSDVIKVGDKIFVIAKKKDIPAIETLLGFKTEKPKKVFIVGGGQVGLWVAQRLEARKIEVYLVEKDEERCEELAEELEDTIILNLDGLDAQELKKEGIDQADLVITVTDVDTVNILGALLAKHHGAKKCIVRIDRPDFIPLLGGLGIDVALSPRLLAANQILRFVRRGQILSVATFLVSDAEVVEMVIPETEFFSKGRRLLEIDFPKGAIVGAIYRAGEVIIPKGETILQPGDDLVIFAKREALPKLEQLFST
ncbi:TrkA-N domain protein [Thermodesulfatator indicus DSM 15286]|uniref:Trk system potassium uptake protein TrkA n=1 Tax=Thermodesulfatator indicus (strain DSM 15286 / JCM 11887 / CIR29812) TaxID=667014 RepID=F8ACQ6_THEID|nr:Trk system potassium transporter TrkA [Thermodesulfatator indicus]AEH45836.1 TrkA-N domain protein [Thermodesulfatator indicus DSM 15286]